MRFTEYYLTETRDWRDKYVWHTTPTGMRNRVMVKSLPPEEQEKYKPAWLRRKSKIRRSGAKPGVTAVPSGTPARKTANITYGGVGQKDMEEGVYLFDFYYGVDSQKGAGDFAEDTYIKATDEPSVAREVFVDKDEQLVVRASNVPVQAVMQYRDEDGEWKNFDDDMDNEEKAEFVEDPDVYMFLLDLFSYKDDIQLHFFKPYASDEEEVGSEEETEGDDE